MIEVGATGIGVDDATGVVVEDLLIGLNSYGDDTLLDGTLEGVGRSGGNIGVVLDGDLADISQIGLARAGGTLLGGVRVLGLSGLRVLLEVLEGLVLPATIATEASLVAGNELLLREVGELAGSSEVSVLDGSGGREGPAGTTVSLVLDGVDTTLGSPVSTVGGRGEVLEVLLGNIATLVAEELLELSLGPGGEHVVADGESVLGVSVDLSESLVLGGKELESVFVLLLGGVRELVLSDVLHESRLKSAELIADLVLDTNERGGVAKEVHFQKIIIIYGYFSPYE